MSWVVVSFGSGKAWRPALKRIKNQAEKLEDVKVTLLFDEQAIPNLTRSDIEQIRNYPRGYGLWFWKPRIILHALKMYPDCSGVIYVDAGCEIRNDQFSQNRLRDYLAVATQRGGLAFELPFLEESWTHPKCMEVMELTPAKNQKQIAGGIIVLANSPNAIELMSEWDQWISYNDFFLLKEENLGQVHDEAFQEHRHDQSIISLLWHARKLPTLPDETFWHPKWKEHGNGYPIWATRSKLRISITTNSLALSAYRAIRFVLKKVSQGRVQV
jgi:hypothetical protein